MEDKLIIISYQDQILDSFNKVFSVIAMDNYLVQNQLIALDVLEFEAFVFINVDFLQNRNVRNIVN